MLAIKVYNAPQGRGPNPWKVNILLEELGVPYETVWIPYGEIKQEPYTLLNPNGRVPAMVDPNKNVTLWESGAIVNYLIATYDKDLRFTYGDDRFEEKWQLQSWLMFQMSGQGPMFGQKVWFTYMHVEENLTTAIDRYGNEAKRILGMMDGFLGKRRKSLGLGPDAPVWLVGDKYTYADLSFIPWNTFLPTMFPNGDLNLEQDYPEFFRWHMNMISRPATKKVLEYREECIRTLTDTGSAVVARQKDARGLPNYGPTVGISKS
ncbi:glutathione transferase [Hypomontagnella monticulosa]|nr:glutathione transferase [Hypomontagnella monticulosa]